MKPQKCVSNVAIHYQPLIGPFTRTQAATRRKNNNIFSLLQLIIKKNTWQLTCYMLRTYKVYFSVIPRTITYKKIYQPLFPYRRQKHLNNFTRFAVTIRENCVTQHISNSTLHITEITEIIIYNNGIK